MERNGPIKREMSRSKPHNSFSASVCHPALRLLPPIASEDVRRQRDGDLGGVDGGVCLPRSSRGIQGSWGLSCRRRPQRCTRRPTRAAFPPAGGDGPRRLGRSHGQGDAQGATLGYSEGAAHRQPRPCPGG